MITLSVKHLSWPIDELFNELFFMRSVGAATQGMSSRQTSQALLNRPLEPLTPCPLLQCLLESQESTDVPQHTDLENAVLFLPPKTVKPAQPLILRDSLSLTSHPMMPEVIASRNFAKSVMVNSTSCPSLTEEPTSRAYRKRGAESQNDRTLPNKRPC